MPGLGFPTRQRNSPGREALTLAEMPDAVDLGRGKDREHLLEPRGQRRAALLLGGHVKG